MNNRIKVLLSVIGISLVLNGCIFSLHPLWTQENKIFDASLLGTWYVERCENPDPESCPRLEFASMGDSAYRMTQYADMRLLRNETGDSLSKVTFLCTAVKLGKHTFLDLYPEEESIGKRFSENFFPVHSFMKIQLAKDQFSIALLNHDRLAMLFDQKRIRIRHETIGDYTILTASTQELGAFMEKYADDPNAFEEVDNYVRK